MSPSSPSSGPGEGILGIGQRILTVLVGMVEVRLKLAVLELEEEKEHLVRLAIMAGVTLLCASFSLMSLLFLVFWIIDPADRVVMLLITTAILFGLAVIGTILIIASARRSTFLKATREQLALDRSLLEKEK